MDRESYRKFYKLPSPRDKEAVKSLSSNKLSLKNSNYRIDYRAKTFMRIMKFEIVIFILSVSSIFMLKYFSTSLQHKGPKEVVKKNNLTEIQKEIEKTLKQIDQN